MQQEEVKVCIRRTPWSQQVDIWFTIQQGKDMSVAKPVILEFEPVTDTGKEIKPTLTIPFHIADAFLKAVTEELEHKRIKTINENHLEGKMGAMKAHLEDMRSLVFGKKKMEE